MTANDTPTKKKRSIWPWLVVSLLSGHTLLIVTAVTLAVRDPSFAVVPDYYDKAVDYDHYKADLQASAELGWTLTIKPGSIVDEHGQRLVTADVLDRDGQPLAGLDVQLSVIFLGGGQPQRSAVLQPTGQGYMAAIEMPHSGAYSYDLSAKREAQHFVQSGEIDVAGSMPQNGGGS